MTTDAEYIDWLLDVSRANYRILLVELDHSAGTIYLGSDAWQSETGQAYDDWLMTSPMMEDSLYDFLGVGDIVAVNLDTSDDWLSSNCRGFECRWFFGDSTWVKADFKQLTTCLINGCRFIRPKTYQFDLMDSGQSLRRTWTHSVYNYNSSARTGMDAIMVEAGMPTILYTSVPAGTRSMRIDITVTDQTLLTDVLKKFTDSIGAHFRVQQSGALEVYIPDLGSTPEITLTEDDIEYRGVRMVEKIPAYRNVSIEWFDGTLSTLATGAVTGDVANDLTIKTYLRRLEDVDIRVAEEAAYYATSHAVWELKVFDLAGLLQVGDHVAVVHDDLTGSGIVNRVRRTPLSTYTILELTV